MIKRTYKSLSSTRLLRLWREERERRKAEAACKQLTRDLSALPLDDLPALTPRPESKRDYTQPMLDGSEQWITRDSPPKPASEIREPKPAYVARPIPDEMVKWLNDKHIVIKRLEDWRWLDSKLFGQIHGLPRSRGRAMMANGVFVLIERGDGSVFWGHECHWVEDQDPNKTPTKRSEKAKMNAILGAKLRELLAM